LSSRFGARGCVGRSLGICGRNLRRLSVRSHVTVGISLVIIPKSLGHAWKTLQNLLKILQNASVMTEFNPNSSLFKMKIREGFEFVFLFYKQYLIFDHYLFQTSGRMMDFHKKRSLRI